MATGFTNSFTSGEISEEAWDRVDLQPIAKGCEEAINYMIRVSGPLGKRRGFWRLGSVADESKPGRLVPFRRSIDDALMLEFGDLIVRVWNNTGAPYPDSGGAQVTFASPYTSAQLDGLRFKQVGDVIYLRHRDGLTPRSLTRLSNVSWSFAVETFPKGPWRPENTNPALTISLAGDSEGDANPKTDAGSILAGTVVDVLASDFLWTPEHVGSLWRLRQNDGSPGVTSWRAGYAPSIGWYALSNGRVYKSVSPGSDPTEVNQDVATPPTVTQGFQSDGFVTWEYRHDGNGIIRLDTIIDGAHATATVLATVPLASGRETTAWAECAYSDYRGWPRMWPGLREERIVEGATRSNLDFVDLTETAGFTPTSESFNPVLAGNVVEAINAVRRRVGDDGAELIWAHALTYLVVGSASGEYLVAGSVLDEPISPSSVVVKQLSDFGSADVYPAKAHKGLIFVARGGQTLREVAIDATQNEDDNDLTVLAQHITRRGLAQIAWVAQPDETLWIRLADGGLAAMVYHKQQQVRGFSRTALGGGFKCEDIVVLPGPGRLETLWMIVSRVKAGATQRCIWQMSEARLAMFMDGAGVYTGPPVTAVGGLAHYEGEALRVLVAPGPTQTPPAVVAGGAIALPFATTNVWAGLPYKSRFKSLKLDRGLGGSLNRLQRVTGCIVSLKTALATVGVDGFKPETVMPRTAKDVIPASAHLAIKAVTIAGDTLEDPRIVVEDDTAYESLILSLKPEVTVGA